MVTAGGVRPLRRAAAHGLSVAASRERWPLYTRRVPAITAQLVVEQAERLGEGGHPYTARQLYYASCAAVESGYPSATKGIIGIAAVLILLGASLVRLAPPAAVSLALIGAAGLLFALLNQRTEQAQALARAREPRPLAMSYDGFSVGPLREALAGEPERLRLLIAAEPDRHDAAGTPGQPGGAGGRRPRGALLLACEREETGRMLAANLAHLPPGSEVVVLPAGDGTVSPSDAWARDGGEDPVPGRPAAVRRRRVIAVHDADPLGCALPSRLRRAGAAEVIDVGLRPPPSDARLAVLEGAPARVPGEVEEDLSDAEVGWLRSGRRLELATLTPEQVVARIAGAVPRSRPLSPVGTARRNRPPSPLPAQPESATVSPAGSQTPAR